VSILKTMFGVGLFDSRSLSVVLALVMVSYLHMCGPDAELVTAHDRGMCLSFHESLDTHRRLKSFQQRMYCKASVTVTRHGMKMISLMS
jgi:hypothetical protein